ncbi:MAG: type II toxin-antitoxin system ParD family antitoxin [Proteobacteria bacterium]|nr:type II toxin-antitoxin system ParD family antitoxin [Pseudomonadota bacterium]
MSTNVHLSPALEEFARECVDSGRYNNVSEVVRDALRLLQEREERRRQFNVMLDEAVAEADRDGWIPHEEVMAELDRIIDAAEKEKKR